jgi:hypothetical protein
MLFPSLLQAGGALQKRAMLVVFLPRYRSHEETIAAHFEIAEIVDSPLMKGFRAVRDWLRAMTGRRELVQATGSRS